LIHDIGIMVEIQARRNQFVEVLQKLDDDPGKPLLEAETEVLGATHEQFGQGLCKLWKFPQSFQYVTGFHHRPGELAEGQRTLTGLVHVADVITKQLGIGFTAGTAEEEVDPALLKELGLTDGYLKEVAEQLPEAIEEASGIFQMGG
ncbi:MAG: HDOD domain-containing protein, partial [Planctomycetota bacterium]